MKDVLLAVLCFIATAVFIAGGMTFVGDYIYPEIGNVAASYDKASSEKAPDTEQADTKKPVMTAAAEPVPNEPVKEEKPEVVAVAEPAEPVKEEKPEVVAVAEPVPAPEPEKSPEDISKLTASLKKGKSIDLGDGRVAYKVKSGDSFSRICQKVTGTSTKWREEAKKLGIDYRKIKPGQILIFDTKK